MWKIITFIKLNLWKDTKFCNLTPLNAFKNERAEERVKEWGKMKLYHVQIQVLYDKCMSKMYQ